MAIYALEFSISFLLMILTLFFPSGEGACYASVKDVHVNPNTKSDGAVGGVAGGVAGGADPDDE